MAMILYSAALIISCFFMAWGAALLTRPLMSMLRNDEEEDVAYANGVVIAWVAFGFLQVVGMPFAWWCLCIAVSVLLLLRRPAPFGRASWWLLLLASLGAAGAVYALDAPKHLITEALIIAAASFAGLRVSRGRRGLSCEKSAIFPLVMALGYVAYSAALPTLTSLMQAP